LDLSVCVSNDVTLQGIQSDNLFVWSYFLVVCKCEMTLKGRFLVVTQCCPLNCLQIIMLSASANKLSRLKEQAEEYAALIMEELDPEELGYIEVSSLFFCVGHRNSMQ
jgi:hypothetical protein